MKPLLDDPQFQADLTRDILSDADLSRLCSATAKTARRRRFVQQTKLPVALALILAAALLFPKPAQQQQQQQTIAQKPATPPTPVLAHNIVTTQPFANIIHSEPAPTISTPQHLTYRILTDDELLQLLDGYALAFHRTPSGRLQLEFLQ